jgi:phage-related protein
MPTPRNKPIDWIGLSFKDLCDDDIFPEDARCAAGYQLRKVQRGHDPMTGSLLMMLERV